MIRSVLNYVRISRHSGWVLLALILLFSCRGNKSADNELDIDTGAIVTYAERFKIERNEGYTKLTVINPWQGAEGINHIFYLIRKGSTLPKDIDSAEAIFVPLEKIICMSTTHLAMISALNEENTVSGVSGARFIYRNSIYEKLKKDQIPDVGYEGNLNKELIIKISPDLIMMYGIGSESTGYINKIKELGLKTIFNADYLETDPLGKAEWIKMFGALYCKEKLADSIFKSLAEEYLHTKSHIEKNAGKKPKVLLGLPYKDTWFISPGNSYISAIIDDAGGDYLWKETKSSYSMPYGIENVYLKALEADYWLNIGSAGSKDDIMSVDKRLAGLECFKTGNLYNNNNRVNEYGGNDYWESGSLYPQLILRDIASIIHPGLFSNELYYYRKLD